MHRADHVVEAREVRAPCESEEDCTKERAHKAFNGFLWRKSDERRAPDGHTPHIRKDIVADDKRCRNPEPDKAFKDIVHNEVAVATA
jgi:hypothetical protein